jgi:hypothetical protein
LKTTEQKKNKQHYVWRFYLEAWADENDLIFCHRKGKLFKPNIKDVAQQRNFYRLKELTDDEVTLVKLMIEKSPRHLHKIHHGILRTFTAPHIVKSIIDSTGDSPASVLESLDVLINNIEEDIHAGIERKSIKYIDSIRAEDVLFWEDRQDRFNFLNFITLQLFRTKRIQDSLSEAIDIKQPNDRKLENVLGVLRHILSLNVADSLCHDSQYTIILLLNDSNTPFITGDQPVINTHGVDSGLFDIPTEFEIYYPVSPKKAIIITANSTKFSTNPVFVTAENVELYNSFIIKRSHEQLFSNSELMLEQLTSNATK